MRRTFVPILLSGLLVLAACATPPDPKVLRDQGKELQDRFVAAFNSGDVDAVLELYWTSPDVSMMPLEEMLWKGPDAVQQGWRDWMARYPGARLEITESHQTPSGELVVGWGTWKVTVTGPDGSPMELAGRFTDIKAERGGKWVFLHDHVSMPTPPPPEPETKMPMEGEG